ncbi:MAG TPA: hypothetical protein VFE82_03510 [Ramlibacter sp.]|jgi:hypothetical protein|uniref:hypothetical protein n=1 Tax=Ramlibacter sp. TaxID=1917967 RepID=UPI002D226158|nr:hypothetical protein [Ramlibacter sp.]HZY17519.1 hypothetical protein [Ramlibacter sp.]
MSYRYEPPTFGDVVAILEDAVVRPDVLARLQRQFVPGLWWSVDRSSRSYVLPMDGQLEFEGSGYLLYFRGEFFEFKVEPFGARVAFYQPPQPVHSTVAEVQAAFAQEIAVYARGAPASLEPLNEQSPIFVGTYEELWKRRA